MKILHLSDLHLGTSFKGFHKQCVSCAKVEIKDIVLSLPKIVEQYRINMLIIAGDLFDGSSIDAHWFYLVKTIFDALLAKACYIVYATGNHDYFITEMHFKRQLSSDYFVLFCKDFVQQKDIQCEGKRIVLHGVGYNVKQPNHTVIESFNVAQDDKIHIGIAHGVVGGYFTEGKAPYYKMSVSQIEALHYDYFALGHVHTMHYTNAKWAYCGSPIPVRIDETGTKNALLVKVAKNNTEITPLILSDFNIKELHYSIMAENVEHLCSELLVKLSTCGDDSDKTQFILGLTLEIGFIWQDFYEDVLVENLLSFGYSVIIKKISLQHQTFANNKGLLLLTPYIEKALNNDEIIFDSVKYKMKSPAQMFKLLKEDRMLYKQKILALFRGEEHED